MDKELTLLLENYRPTQEAISLIHQITTILLVGITGAGKDSIKHELLEKGTYHDIVSHTTRAPRKNNGILEKDGQEYHFISKEQAKEMIENHQFIEAKWVHRQNIYGTSVAEFQTCLSDGKIALADIEVQGVDEYIELSPKTTKPIFLLPPDFSIWLKRFKSRYEGHVGSGEFRERLHTATEEIKHVLQHPYFSIVVNDDLEIAAQEVDIIAQNGIQSDATIEYGRRCAMKLLHDISNHDVQTI